MRNKEHIRQYLTKRGLSKEDAETMSAALVNNTSIIKALTKFFEKEYAHALQQVEKNSMDTEVIEAANTARTIRKLAAGLDIKISLDIKTEIE